MSTVVDLRVPSSKSETHRALLLGALSSVPCTVHHPLLGADCRSTLEVLQSLGARAHLSSAAVHFQPIHRLHAAEGLLDCGNSGTTLRLMLAQVARLTRPSTLTGDASLQTRPNGPLLDALEQLGAQAHSLAGRAPITISGPLQAGHVVLPPRVSSQYASALLLALSMVPGASSLHLQAPVASRPYLDITRTVAAQFGLKWTAEDREDGVHYTILGGQSPSAEAVEVAGDWSGAAFALVAGVLLDQPVRLHGLRRDSAQGDRRVVQILQAFGQTLSWSGDALELAPAPIRGGVTLDLGATPDLFPALAVLAACAEQPSRLAGAPSLRHKECDRISAMVQGLRTLGADVEELRDGLRVRSHRPLHGGDVRSHHDHRVYMAFRVLGARLAADAAGQVQVDGQGCEAVSYPRFADDLHRICTARRPPHLSPAGRLR